MTAPTEYSRTDGPGPTPRWIALVLATLATLLAIGVLWSLAPSTCVYAELEIADDSILPGPQSCGDGGTAPALVTAGILLALLASVFVAAFTVVRNRGRVLLILGGIMLLVLIIGLLATVTAAQGQPPIIYY